MKEKGKYLKLVILISVIVVIAVICTAIITIKMVSRDLKNIDGYMSIKRKINPLVDSQNFSKYFAFYANLSQL